MIRPQDCSVVFSYMATPKRELISGRGDLARITCRVGGLVALLCPQRRQTVFFNPAWAAPALESTARRE